MWLLTIEDDEGGVSNHALSGDRCTVGRAPDRNLVLSEVNVSRHHARFERRSNDWYVIDEGSYNGTFVNGCAIRPKALTLLEKGDTVQFGGYRLALSVGEAVGELPPPPDPLTPARLRVIAGLSIGAEYAFERQDFVTIGSADDCSIVLTHENVSPLHATIRTLPGGRYELADRSRTGLLFVNGRPVIGEQTLEGGDAVDVGGVALFRFLEPSQWPDPRFDMVSNPDAWLSVDVAPYDDRPTLDELPDPDDGSGFIEPLIVVDAPTPPIPTPLVAVVIVPEAHRSGPTTTITPVVHTAPPARISGVAAAPPARISGLPLPPAPPGRSATTPVPAVPPARSPTTPVPGAPPARSPTTPVPGVPPARSLTTPVPGVPPTRSLTTPVPGVPPARGPSASGSNAARSAGTPVPSAPARSRGTPVPALAPARSPGTPVPDLAPARSPGTPVPDLAPARSPGTPVPDIAPARISGTGERLDSDDSLPGSSRRQMLATLKRLASW